MNNPLLGRLALMYIKAFAEKDVGSLDVLLSDNVILTDWEFQLVGKMNVMAFNEELFNKVGPIRIDIKGICTGQNSVSVEIILDIDGKRLQVVDILEFDDENKIRYIRAYMQ